MMMNVKAVLRIFVFALTVALAVAPAVLDGCLMTCQTPATGVNRAQGSAEHSCHEAGHSESAYRFQSEQAPCSHDHGETALGVTTAADGNRPLKSVRAPLGLVTADSLRVNLVGAFGTPPSRSIPISRSLSSFALPLRV